MLRITFLFGFSTLLFSCNKKMGGFQASSNYNFSPTQKKTMFDKSSANNFSIMIEDSNVQNAEYEASVSNDIPPISMSITDGTNEFFKNSEESLSSRKKIKLADVGSSTIVENSNNDGQIPHKLRRNPIFNDSLKIGLVFLLIAAALSFLPALMQLAVLFAVVAMVFLFIGLKKLFNHRAKIKQKKIRKENNQVRKEKIKDIFKK
jgi:hypothetical protein